MTGELQGAARAVWPVLDPLELYSGIIAGRRRSALPADIEERDPGASPREVLERLLLEPLTNGPCHVAFSGGRDSSAMLATATHVARRHGLPDPIPLTVRMEQHPRTWETEWQELTIRHLGISEWKLVPVVHELDALGADAQGALRRHGLYWPSQAHSMLVFARNAGSGSLLTGGGGDEVFAGWSQRKVAFRRLIKLHPRRRAAKWIALSSLPQRAQTELLLARQKLETPWVRPEVERRLQREYRQRSRRRTKDWGEVLEGFIDSRYLEFLRPVLDTFAMDHGVRLHEPFYDPRFIRAVVRAAPPEGYAGRTAGLEANFHDVLPREVIERSTKAVFTEAAWGPNAREFVAAWDGRGLDERYVAVDALREEWAKPRPSPRSIPCLHQAWLAAHELA